MKELLINGGILFVTTFIQTCAQSFIYTFLFNLDFSIKHRIVFASIITLCYVAFKLFVPMSASWLNPIMFIIMTTSLLKYYNMDRTIWKCLLYSLFVMLLAAPIELLSGLIVFYVLQKSPADTNSTIISIPTFLLIDFWHIIIALSLYFVKKKQKLTFDIGNKSTYINILFAFLFIGPNIVFYTSNRYNYPLYLLIYNIIANLSLVILSAYNTYKSMQLEIKKRDLINSELHNKSLKELLDSIRVFKHDYNNLIHAIGGYISCGDIKGLEKYYKGASKEAKRVNRLESISPIKINEPSVYGLIAGKFEFADSKGVDFNFESIFDYQKLDMPIYDFCKIFGILLDNAIEAAEEVDELKEVNVYVRENKLEGYQAFVIENTYANKDVDTEQIYEKDFSTKNRNSGIGLWEVRRIVNKFDNVTLTTSKNDDYFRQELYIEIISKEAEEESPKELSSTLDS